MSEVPLKDIYSLLITNVSSHKVRGREEVGREHQEKRSETATCDQSCFETAIRNPSRAETAICELLPTSRVTR